jgi:DNA-binding beta-propeller fold protein YncE
MYVSNATRSTVRASIKWNKIPRWFWTGAFAGYPCQETFRSGKGYTYIFPCLDPVSVSLFFLGLPSFAATFGTVSPDLGVADLILDEPRGKLYLINSNLNRVDVWCLGSPACPAPGRRFLAPISTGTDPLAGAMSPDGKFLYVTSYNRSPECD